jgi:hypothetical protein
MIFDILGKKRGFFGAEINSTESIIDLERRFHNRLMAR